MVCSPVHLLMAWSCKCKGILSPNDNIGLIPYMCRNIYESPQSILSWIFQLELNTHSLEQQ